MNEQSHFHLINQSGTLCIKTTPACLNCRNKHYRCDNLQPSCSQCIRRNVLCQYTPAKRRGPKKMKTNSDQISQDSNNISQSHSKCLKSSNSHTNSENSLNVNNVNSPTNLSPSSTIQEINTPESPIQIQTQVNNLKSELEDLKFKYFSLMQDMNRIPQNSQISQNLNSNSMLNSIEIQSQNEESTSQIFTNSYSLSILQDHPNISQPETPNRNLQVTPQQNIPTSTSLHVSSHSQSSPPREPNRVSEITQQRKSVSNPMLNQFQSMFLIDSQIPKQKSNQNRTEKSKTKNPTTTKTNTSKTNPTSSITTLTTASSPSKSTSSSIFNQTNSLFSLENTETTIVQDVLSPLPAERSLWHLQDLNFYYQTYVRHKGAALPFCCFFPNQNANDILNKLNSMDQKSIHRTVGIVHLNTCLGDGARLCGNYQHSKEFAWQARRGLGLIFDYESQGVASCLSLLSYLFMDLGGLQRARYLNALAMSMFNSLNLVTSPLGQITVILRLVLLDSYEERKQLLYNARHIFQSLSQFGYLLFNGLVILTEVSCDSSRANFSEMLETLEKSKWIMGNYSIKFRVELAVSACGLRSLLHYRMNGVERFQHFALATLRLIENFRLNTLNPIAIQILKEVLRVARKENCSRVLLEIRSTLQKVCPDSPAVQEILNSIPKNIITSNSLITPTTSLTSSSSLSLNITPPIISTSITTPSIQNSNIPFQIPETSDTTTATTTTQSKTQQQQQSSKASSTKTSTPTKMSGVPTTITTTSSSSLSSTSSTSSPSSPPSSSSTSKTTNTIRKRTYSSISEPSNDIISSIVDSFHIIDAAAAPPGTSLCPTLSFSPPSYFSPLLFSSHDSYTYSPVTTTTTTSSVSFSLPPSSFSTSNLSISKVDTPSSSFKINNQQNEMYQYQINDPNYHLQQQQQQIKSQQYSQSMQHVEPKEITNDNNNTSQILCNSIDDEIYSNDSHIPNEYELEQNNNNQNQNEQYYHRSNDDQGLHKRDSPSLFSECEPLMSPFDDFFRETFQMP